MPKSSLAQLKDALRKKQLIRFSRKFEESSVHGYVLDIGPKFFLLATVSDRIWFDGFECIRIHDVGGVIPEPHARFAEAALKKRGERMPKKPRVSLVSLGELLLSAGRAFPLVTIHREEVESGCCWIGRILGIKRGRVSLMEIDPDAEWDREPTAYRLSEITRVDFGCDYENALILVGGNK